MATGPRIQARPVVASFGALGGVSQGTGGLGALREVRRDGSAVTASPIHMTDG